MGFFSVTFGFPRPTAALPICLICKGLRLSLNEFFLNPRLHVAPVSQREEVSQDRI